MDYFQLLFRRPRRWIGSFPVFLFAWKIQRSYGFQVSAKEKKMKTTEHFHNTTLLLVCEKPPIWQLLKPITVYVVRHFRILYHIFHTNRVNFHTEHSSRRVSNFHFSIISKNCIKSINRIGATLMINFSHCKCFASWKDIRRILSSRFFTLQIYLSLNQTRVPFFKTKSKNSFPVPVLPKYQILVQVRLEFTSIRLRKVNVYFEGTRSKKNKNPPNSTTRASR